MDEAGIADGKAGDFRHDLQDHVKLRTSLFLKQRFKRCPWRDDAPRNHLKRRPFTAARGACDEIEHPVKLFFWRHVRALNGFQRLETHEVLMSPDQDRFKQSLAASEVIVDRRDIDLRFFGDFLIFRLRKTVFREECESGLQNPFLSFVTIDRVFRIESFGIASTFVISVSFILCGIDYTLI